MFEFGVSVSILILGIGLSAAPFFIHEHAHPGHLGLTADPVACGPPNSGESVSYSGLSPAVQDAIRQAIDREGEMVVLHQAELINGDEGGDWRPDSDEEWEVGRQLDDRADNETRIKARETACYVLRLNEEAGGGFVPLTPLVWIVGVPMILYGLYDIGRRVPSR